MSAKNRALVSEMIRLLLEAKNDLSELAIERLYTQVNSECYIALDKAGKKGSRKNG